MYLTLRTVIWGRAYSTTSEETKCLNFFSLVGNSNKMLRG